ncbi:MAG: ABC transporter ATP-binding protein [Bacilli bacterium]|nr:ABC transporter ATP-binding protein [Bacilli bacterium]
MSNIVEVNSLTKSYGNFIALENINLSVKKATVFGLIGANGAGKSTLIECILGVKKFEKGEVTIFSQNPNRKRKELFQKIGVQFQESDYQSEIKVNELCQEMACLYKHPQDWKALCKKFNIEDKIKQSVKSLSGGEKQRLFIVLALIGNPKLVFLDELTTGLDSKARKEVWNILSSLKKEGLTIFLTSHFMDEVEALCDEICILKNGKIVFNGTIEEVKKETECSSLEEAYLKITSEEE